MSGIPAQAIFDTLSSHAQASGYFDNVQTHEPKKAPTGLNCSIFLADLTPVDSGLDQTSAMLTINIRIQQNMLKEPQDSIDVDIILAATDMMKRIIGDFTLGGNVKNVDIRGRNGTKLAATAGYINQDNILFRATIIKVPCVINDVWTETA